METCLSLIIIEASHWYASPEWWLVAAAFLTLGVVVAQTIATAEAAKAASDAASAAKLSVDAADRQITTMEAQTRALIASERAWLAVTLEKPMTGTAINHGQHFVTVGVECTLRNLGKTPARLIGTSASLLMLDSQTSLNSLPYSPDLTTSCDFGSLPEFIPGPGTTEPVLIALSCEGVRLGEMLVVYGIVRYKHVLSDAEVHTIFGYTINHNDRLQRLPSEFPEYNKSV